MRGEKSYNNNMDQLRSLVIIGAGGHAVSVANVALSAGYAIKCFIDKNKKYASLLGFTVIDGLDEVGNINDFSFAIAIGDNAEREIIYKEIVNMEPSAYFPILVHRSAVVSFFVEIGDGTVVMPKAVIGPNSNIGKFCLINTQASVDHDCVMSDFSSLGPAAVTGGAVEIGFRSAVSIGATIKHGIKIGDDSVIGANSYLNKNLPSNRIAYGTPAKQIRTRNPRDSYLK